jgi:hypothetical protein
LSDAEIDVQHGHEPSELLGQPLGLQNDFAAHTWESPSENARQSAVFSEFVVLCGKRDIEGYLRVSILG